MKTKMNVIRFVKPVSLFVIAVIPRQANAKKIDMVLIPLYHLVKKNVRKTPLLILIIVMSPYIVSFPEVLA